MGNVIAVVSGKGGTGKSTFCVALGSMLVRRGHTVVLVDCDCGMHTLDTLTGCEKNIVFDISDALKGNCTEDKIIFPCEYPKGLYLVSAPHNPNDLVSAEQMKQFTQQLKNRFDYVITDAPSGIDKGFETAVSGAQMCLVVANAEPVSVRCCVSVRRKLCDLNKNNIRLVINKFSRRDFHRQNAYPDLDAVIDESGIQLIGIIAEDKKIAWSLQSVMQGKDVKTMESVRRIACRIDGDNIPLLIG